MHEKSFPKDLEFPNQSEFLNQRRSLYKTWCCSRLGLKAHSALGNEVDKAKKSIELLSLPGKCYGDWDLHPKISVTLENEFRPIQTSVESKDTWKIRDSLFEITILSMETQSESWKFASKT